MALHLAFELLTPAKNARSALVLVPSALARSAAARHAKNKSVGLPNDPVLVIGFWDKNTVACAGAMPYRRYFPATIRILSFQAKKGLDLARNSEKQAGVASLAWLHKVGTQS